jgi:kynureninase
MADAENFASAGVPGSSARDAMAALDREEPLRAFREAFVIPPGMIYLDGNSLGLLPKAGAARARRTVESEWGQSAISGWNDHQWIDLPIRVGSRIAGLIGAGEDEVVAGETTSVNLFKCLSAALMMRPGRRTIVTSKSNFPTDIYVAEGLADMLGLDIRYAEPSQVSAAVDDSVAAITFSHVNYRTARIEDMAAITACAHEAGALAIWDLCHSAGAVPVALNEQHVDFAVGCGYKYLNGGPGAPAFLFAARRHHAEMRQPLSGWMGHASPFEFDAHYRPAQGIRRMLTGTPPVVALSILEDAVGIVLDAGIDRLREKSKKMSALLVELVERECRGHGLEFGSPRDEEKRGNHVIFHHPEAYAVVQALKARGVVGDFRAPDCIRLGIAPIYLAYEDIWHAVQHLRQVMENREWARESFRVRAAVT